MTSLGPNFASRRGVSLIEVVFSVGVATVGLLAAVALLPVAARRVEKGRIEDGKAAVGEAALQMCETLAVRDPNQWRTLGSVAGGYTGFSYNGSITRATTSPVVPVSFPGTDARRIDAGTYLNPSFSGGVFGTDARPVNWAPIHSFCIDPWLLSDAALLFSSPAAMEDGTIRDTVNTPPAAEHDDSFYNLQYFPYYVRNPYDKDPKASVSPARELPMFNMRRLTLSATPGRMTPGMAASASMGQLSQSQAERLFASSDDVQFLRENANRAAPARQSPFRALDSNLSQLTLRRETRPDFSWMVTLAPERFDPSSYAYAVGQNGMGFWRQGQSSLLAGDGTYTMSVVVHYRRARPSSRIALGAYSGATYATANSDLSDELVANIASPATIDAEKGASLLTSRGFYGGGIAGGEALIETTVVGGDIERAVRPLQSLKSGSWVMISGVGTGRSPTGPRARVMTTDPPTPSPAEVGNFFNPTLPVPAGMTPSHSPSPAPAAPVAAGPVGVRHQWYRVVSVGEIIEPSGTGIADRYALPVTLQGADWQIHPTFPVQVTIVPSVVAVFEKSVTLEEPLQ